MNWSYLKEQNCSFQSTILLKQTSDCTGERCVICLNCQLKVHSIYMLYWSQKSVNQLNPSLSHAFLSSITGITCVITLYLLIIYNWSHQIIIEINNLSWEILNPNWTNEKNEAIWVERVGVLIYKFTLTLLI